MATEFSTVVDTLEGAARLVNKLVNSESQTPELYISFEGHKLMLDRPIAVMELLFFPERHVYLIDIQTLGPAAFNTAGPSGITLRNILESTSISKVMFDVREDACVLFHHYGIELQGVYDLQLMDLATRSWPHEHVNRLVQCIRMDLKLPVKSRCLGLAIEQHRRLMWIELISRPLSELARICCVGKVIFYPRFWGLYWQRMSPLWRARVASATVWRLQQSYQTVFTSGGWDPASGPLHWLRMVRDRAYIAPSELPLDFQYGCDELLNILDSFSAHEGVRRACGRWSGPLPDGSRIIRIDDHYFLVDNSHERKFTPLHPRRASDLGDEQWPSLMSDDEE